MKEDRPIQELGDIFTAEIIECEPGGNVPHIDPEDCCAHLFALEIEANADNPEVLQGLGPDHLTIRVYRDHWHIER